MSRRFARAERALGVLAVVGSLVANPAVLERCVLFDGQLDHPGRIVAVEALGVLCGVCLLLHARRSSRASPTPGDGRGMAKFVLASVVTLLALPAAEWFLRSRVDPLLILRGSRLNEARWKRAHAGGGHPNLAYDSDVYDEKLGWKPRPNFDQDDVRTNSQGIRADREYSVARSPDRHRIVVIGDSFSWGEEVSNQETYANDLEGLLPDTEVLNLAVHGYGTDQQLLRLQQFGLPFAPDLVILGFFEENMDRNVLSFRDFAKPMFELDGDRLCLLGVPVPRPEDVMAAPELRSRWFLPALVCGALDHALDRTLLRPLEGRDSWKITRALFGEIHRSAEASGARLLLVFIPPMVRRTAGAIERGVQDWARSTNTKLVDMRDVFARRPESEWSSLYRKIHWSPHGNAVAAEAIRDVIVREDLLRAHRGSGPPGPRQLTSHH